MQSRSQFLPETFGIRGRVRLDDARSFGPVPGPCPRRSPHSTDSSLPRRSLESPHLAVPQSVWVEPKWLPARSERHVAAASSNGWMSIARDRSASEATFLELVNRLHQIVRPMPQDVANRQAQFFPHLLALFSASAAFTSQLFMAIPITREGCRRPAIVS